MLADLVLRAYPIQIDDADLRRVVVEQGANVGPWFDKLRKDYPLRREFSATRVLIEAAPPSWPADWRDRIAALGFQVD